MTGRTHSGAEAAAAGLVTTSVPEIDLDENVSALAQHISDAGPLSVQGAKRTIQVVMDNLAGARAARRDDAGEVDELLARAYRSEDLAEGLRAMAEKRPPASPVAKRSERSPR